MEGGGSKWENETWVARECPVLSWASPLYLLHRWPLFSSYQGHLRAPHLSLSLWANPDLRRVLCCGIASLVGPRCRNIWGPVEFSPGALHHVLRTGLYIMGSFNVEWQKPLPVVLDGKGFSERIWGETALMCSLLSLPIPHVTSSFKVPGESDPAYTMTHPLSLQLDMGWREDQSLQQKRVPWHLKAICNGSLPKTEIECD